MSRENPSAASGPAPTQAGNQGGPRLIAVLNRPETADSVLVAARLLMARLPGATVQAFHPRPDIDPDFMPTEEIMTTERRRAFEADRDRIYRALYQAAAAAGFDRPRQLLGRVREVVAHQAQGAAVVIAGSAGDGHAAEAKDAIEAVLFDADAPLLLVSARPPVVLGRRVALAWERSEAAEEAVEAALPLLLGAEGVTVLVAREGHARADLPTGLMTALRAQGAGPAVREFRLAGRDIGDAILAEAQAVEADLLVMGAFTHLRALEALFGGATREIMADARIPVLLHH